MNLHHVLVYNFPSLSITFLLLLFSRPFERTVTLHKSSDGFVGFQFKEGKIISIVKDSSAARNGLLTEHQLLEVDGQNVVGLKDKEITKIIQGTGTVVTITIMPCVLYDHIMKQYVPRVFFFFISSPFFEIIK
jgi:syntenin-1